MIFLPKNLFFHILNEPPLVEMGLDCGHVWVKFNIFDHFPETFNLFTSVPLLQIVNNAEVVHFIGFARLVSLTLDLTVLG